MSLAGVAIDVASVVFLWSSCRFICATCRFFRFQYFVQVVESGRRFLRVVFALRFRTLSFLSSTLGLRSNTASGSGTAVIPAMPPATATATASFTSRGRSRNATGDLRGNDRVPLLAIPVHCSVLLPLHLVYAGSSVAVAVGVSCVTAAATAVVCHRCAGSDAVLPLAIVAAYDAAAGVTAGKGRKVR